MKDEFGIETAKQLGIRVAEAAIRLAEKRACCTDPLEISSNMP